MIQTLILAVTAAGAFTPNATCPARHNGTPLASFQIYDGPLADNAVLAPDTTRESRGVVTEEWGVTTVYTSGRHLNLRCSYGKHGDVIVALPRPVKQCNARLTKNERSVTCR